MRLGKRKEPAAVASAHRRADAVLAVLDEELARSTPNRDTLELAGAHRGAWRALTVEETCQLEEDVATLEALRDEAAGVERDWSRRIELAMSGGRADLAQEARARILEVRRDIALYALEIDIVRRLLGHDTAGALATPEAG